MAESTHQIRLTPLKAPDPETTVFEEDAEAPQHAVSLPQVDGGKDAWLFLTASFLIEVMTWGFAFSFGIFEEYFASHDVLQGPSSIPIVATTQTGIMHIGLPLIFAALLAWPNTKRSCAGVGLLACCVAAASSSFATTGRVLIGTLGVLYGVAGSFASAPCILFIDEWFVRRRSMAYAVVWAGTAVAGVVLPIFLSSALNRFGFRTVLRAWSIAIFLLTIPLLRYVKPRLPSTQSRGIDLSFLKTPSFMILQAVNIIQGLGFFLPSIFLPSYALHVGASTFLSTLTLALFNGASIGGRLAMGVMIDKLHVTTCLFICGLGSAVAIFLLWGLSNNLPLLYAFCIFYGIFAGSITSTWPGVTRLVSQKTLQTTDPGMIFGFLAAGRGIGSVVSGPLSEALLRGMPWHGRLLRGYGSGYGPLIVFTGVSAVLGGCAVLGRFKRGLL